MNNLIQDAKHIPVNESVPVISLSSVVLPAPERGLDIELRVSAPSVGENLPIILLSHGHGPSLYIPSKDGYGPLANFYASHGFVVIQPTHLNSKVAGAKADSPGGPLFWRSRVEDMRTIRDNLDLIIQAVPTLDGRVDTTQVAAVGHSLGGQTVGMLLGARLSDPKDPTAQDVELQDPRVKVGVLKASALVKTAWWSNSASKNRPSLPRWRPPCSSPTAASATKTAISTTTSSKPLCKRRSLASATGRLDQQRGHNAPVSPGGRSSRRVGADCRRQHQRRARAAVYCGTKFAVRAVSEGFRPEAGPNIRSTILSPGAVSSELQSTITHQETIANVKQFTDIAIDPDAMARAVAFAIDQPADVDVNEMLIRPTAQTL